jgi:predicted Rossmann fold flavoprotein
MKTVVVGGGAAGMMAAVAAADNGNEVILIEKNEKLGKKLFITGKGRCNLTNACDDEEFFNNVVTNSKFMYSAYYGFNNSMVMTFFEDNGLKLKVERGDRVFPASDHSSDVIGTLKRCLDRQGVKILLNRRVHSVKTDNGSVTGVELEDGEIIRAGRVVLALGGVSYPGCGASDDTFRIADELGINVTDAEPALVPLVTSEEWVHELQGLSLKNVSTRLTNDKKCLYEGFGEMLFTHYGVSGPLVLSASSRIKEKMYGSELKLHIDLKPALDEKQLDERILRDWEESRNRDYINSLNRLLPQKLIPVIVSLSGTDAHRKINAITKEERQRLVSLIKDLTVTVSGNRGFNEAIITRGGIKVKEINPSTMESKSIKGLYFAGEMIDVDALTGGFNLQIAWSTGHLAGQSAGTAE